MNSKASPRDRASHVRLLLMDVDGVWTDGSLFYLPGSGEELVEVKASSAYDGMALRWFHAAGYSSGLISGRESPGVAFRAEMLGIRYIYQGHLQKIGPYEDDLRASWPIVEAEGAREKPLVSSHE